MTLSELKPAAAYLLGQKIAYVTDVGWSETT